MSRHVQDLLCAYLDGELSPPERGMVEAHLAACEACAGQLEEFAAVDGVARDLPAQAPEGYFDSFPQRLRGRLRAPAATRWRVPVWGWAAAAALLLAVVTPLTLREVAPLRRAAAPPPAASASQGSVAPEPETTLERTARLEADRVQPPETTPEGLASNADEPAPRTRAKREARTVAPVPSEEASAKLRALGYAAPPPPAAPPVASGEDAGVPGGPAGGVVGGSAQTAPKPSELDERSRLAERKQRGVPLGKGRADAPPADSNAAREDAFADRDEPARQGRLDDRQAGGARAAEAGAGPRPSEVQAERADAAPGFAGRPHAEEPAAAAPAPARQRPGAVATTSARSETERVEESLRVAEEIARPGSDEFARLRARSQQLDEMPLEDARALRDAWRSFAARNPGGTRGDEARFHVIEAEQRVWQLGRDPRDRAALERDARTYLARGGARVERVRALLAEIGSAPE